MEKLVLYSFNIMLKNVKEYYMLFKSVLFLLTRFIERGKVLLIGLLTCLRAQQYFRYDGKGPKDRRTNWLEDKMEKDRIGLGPSDYRPNWKGQIWQDDQVVNGRIGKGQKARGRNGRGRSVTIPLCQGALRRNSIWTHWRYTWKWAKINFSLKKIVETWDFRRIFGWICNEMMILICIASLKHTSCQIFKEIDKIFNHGISTPVPFSLMTPIPKRYPLISPHIHKKKMHKDVIMITLKRLAHFIGQKRLWGLQQLNNPPPL